MKKLKAYLLEEGRQLTRPERFHAIWITMAFIFVFLLFFQPFGVNNYDPSERIRWQFVYALAIFVGGSGLILILNEVLLFPLFRPSHRIGIIVWTLWNYILLATSSFLIYNILGEWHDFRWKSYVEFLINFAALGMLPLAGIFIYLFITSLKESLSAAYHYRNDQINGDDIIRIVAENDRDTMVMKLRNLLFIESADNYVEIYYLEDDLTRKSIIRQSLKSIDEQDIHPALFRCHRSYMINLFHVDRVEGNRNKLSVKLNHYPTVFPVSRTAIDALMERIEK